MKGLDVIEIRSARKDRNLVEKILIEIIKDLTVDNKFQKITFYKHSTLKTDFCIHIECDLEEGNLHLPPQIIQLIPALKNLGLTTQSLWKRQFISTNSN